MTSFSLKIVALIAMTLDHAAAYLPGMPVLFHYIGRIAAPIFFFCSVQSYFHCADPGRYRRRLYLAAVLMAFSNEIFRQVCGVYVKHTIFYSLFWGILLIAALQEARREKRGRYLGGILLLWSFHFSVRLLENSVWFQDLRKAEPWLRTLTRIWDSSPVQMLTLSPSELEGGCIWLLLPVFLYWAGVSKRKQCAAYAGFSLLYTAVACTNAAVYTVYHVGRLAGGAVFSLLDNLCMFLGIYQFPTYGTPFYEIRWYGWMVIFALPFFVLYNGERGRKGKYFFYFYYPMHIYLLAGLSKVLL